jgi:predicted DNA-binding transcriptional regulator
VVLIDWASDRGVGASLLIIGIAGIIIYVWLLLTPYDTLVLKITAALAVVSVFGILGWIGYTMLSTPAVPPMTDKPSLETVPKTAQMQDTD